MLNKLNLLFAGYRLQTGFGIALAALSGLLEGLALVTLLPLLQSALNDGAPSSIPASIHRLFDWLFQREQVSPVLIALTLFMTMGASSTLIRYLSDAYTNGLMRRMTNHQFVSAQSALLNTHYSHFISLPIGEINKMILSDPDRIVYMVNLLLQGLAALMIGLIFLSLSFWISAKATLFTILFSLAGLVVFYQFSNKLRKLVQRNNELTISLNRDLSSIFLNFKFIRASGKGQATQGLARDLNHQKTGYQLRFLNTTALQKASFEAGVVVFVALFLGISLLAAGEPVAQMLIFLALFYRMVPRLMTAQTLISQGLAQLPIWETWHQRLEEALAHPEPPVGDIPVERLDSLEMQNVTFHYPESQHPTLSQVSLRIGRGECVAVVGSSGSGKSTLIDLLLGLLTAQEGAVVLNGQPLARCNLLQWQQKVGVVLQNAPVFHATIRENIAWGEARMDQERLERVARQAHAWEFIQEKEEGFDALLGEKGAKLSGGQQQRIALARALYRQPELLVLDEATSALDGHSEAHIQQALQEMKGSMAMLMVAHRLKTIQMADRIIVMENGRIVEQGSWDQLIQKGGHFTKMAHLQGLS